jgi:hypothetical protein
METSSCIGLRMALRGDVCRRPQKAGRRLRQSRTTGTSPGFFKALENDKSLIFYYANYSNPMSEDEAQRYILVGVSRIKRIGEELMYVGCSEQTRQRYGGGFVWDRTITSHYPEQGLRLPYRIYRDRPDFNGLIPLHGPVPCKEENLKGRHAVVMKRRRT